MRFEMAKRKEDLKAKGVVRIDYASSRHGIGWYVRVTFRGKTHSKYFADRVHGGERVAFEKAVAWRNAKEKELGKPRTDRLVPPVSPRSPTGISGVFISRDSYVVASCPAPGELRREFISINKYGAEEAFRRAVELRRRREREMYGRAVSRIDQARRGAVRRSSKAQASRKSTPARRPTKRRSR